MGRVGEGVGAACAVLEQDVDVLAGEELQALAGGQLQVEHRDIFRRGFDFFHPARHGLDRDVLRAAGFARFDDDVRLRLGAAEQRHPGELFGFLQRAFLVVAEIDRAFQNLALACAAGAVAAAVRQQEALAQGGVEYGFPFHDRDRMLARHDRQFV